MQLEMGLHPNDVEFRGLTDGDRVALLQDAAELTGYAMSRLWGFKVSGCMSWPNNFGHETTGTFRYIPK